jgi:hypothetical protein
MKRHCRPGPNCIFALLLLNLFPAKALFKLAY